ncbi:aldo/keto reductase [Halapricum desulfuricans]|uniref:Aldo/keto reductase, related to diketogulonate reductase n=1 Tax=Halapricum desulfuricans TaxID=2841257 RepID=A0A897N8H9_9EURY|nr:aldo/keto reductase [Halapricum desulfuricans]QSG08578.1 Aldo/keto reductase, related to diketogulonate reductase [Halapricum desulfuricans]
MESVTVQGTAVPMLGLGTYQLRGDACVQTVREAIEMGYRHIDTAEYYNNQREVGQGIAAADVDREDIFLTTKVWRSNLAHDDVLQSVQESLDKLGVETVDLLLIHWPSQSVPVGETLTAMEQLQTEGKVRHIGVSNFSVEQLREAMQVAESPVLTNQVKYHPFHSQAELVEFCIEHDVLLTAYSPLAKGDVVGNETLATIGERYGKSAAQVALRWLLQQEVVAAIPKAASRAHLEENMAVFDFELTDAEMERIFELQDGLIAALRDRLGL